MADFADLADAGRRVASALADRDWTGSVVLAVMPRGVPVAAPVASELGLPIVGLTMAPGGDGGAPEPVVTEEVAVAAGGAESVIVVDDGVETGAAARAVAASLRACGARHLVLAVPVCPRDTAAALHGAYDEIVAVVRPLARRSLRWHFDHLESVTDADAAAMLRSSDG